VTGRPNVLLVVLDATRKDHLSCYGHDRPTTPAIDAVAEAGTRYERAITPSPWTPPSHASLFTGCYPSRHGVYHSDLGLRYDGPTLAELLSDAGYATLGFSNSYHTSTDRNFHRGFDYYHDVFELPRFAGTMYEPSLDFVRYVANRFLRNYDESYWQLGRLRTKLRRTDEPFFGFINLNSAHSPYDPPRRYRERFEAYFDDWDTVDEAAARDVANGDAHDHVFGDGALTETEWDLVTCWYDAEIRFVDDLLSSFLDFLRERGLYDDTMLVFVADHGENMGEDGLAYHEFSLSEALLNVPLVVKWPDGSDAPRPGSVSDDLVSLVDVAPTVCEVAGVDPPSGVEGLSLLDDGGHDAVFAEYDRPQPPGRDRLRDAYDAFARYDRGLQAVRTAAFKLVRTTTGEETLYRVDDGPETEADDPEVRRRLGDRLDAALGDLPDAGHHDEDLADHVERHLSEMGYR
jgi:arylsulfatase A-like enzyme